MKGRTLEQRRAGVLLHPTSLPSGTLQDAPRWLDFLQAAGLGVWQVLPLGPPLVGLSPYMCASAFALNTVLFANTHCDMRPCATWCRQQAHWLRDYARFIVIKREQGGQPWTQWPPALRDRDSTSLHALDARRAPALRVVMARQYRAAMRWQALRAQAALRGVQLLGDLPIFVAHDSADVWAQRHLFLLDERGQPSVVAGVPPDYFSATGQRWGNPHYHWAVMQADGFAWWRARLRAQFACFDLVRLDHFRGLLAAWAIPATSTTAIEGTWVAAPGAALLQALVDDAVDEPGRLHLVAEDLGIITPDVTALRHQFGLPGMAVLQFAFDHHADNPHKPTNVQPDTVCYTGTHDNDTTLGWWRALKPGEQPAVREQLGLPASEAGLADEATVLAAMTQAVLHSRAALAVLPLQDLLGLDTRARMNTPGTEEGNWRWRFDWADLPADLAPRLRAQIEAAQRCEGVL